MAGHQVDDDLAALSHANEKERVLREKAADQTSSQVYTTETEDDPDHAGLEFPTEEEIATLRRVSDKVPWKSYLIAVIEMSERFSYYGSTVVFVNFIQRPLPPGSRTGAGFDGQSGALNHGQQASTGLTTFYQFWCYVTPLFGAYIADTYLGRFKTISYSLIIILIGHVILIVSAVPGVIEKEGAIGCFAVALVVMGIGTGGFKSNISPLIAEQYRRTKLFVVTRKNGERVIVDPAMTISRVYMYFYLFTNIGALVGQITMTYAEKYVGFWLAYLLPTAVFLLSPLILLAGRNRYHRSPPTGSVLPSAIRILRHASRGRWSWNPIKTWRNFNVPDFWDSAKPSKQVGDKPAWMHFDDAWVDEVSRGFKACAVFAWFPLWWMTYNQINNNLTSQAATMSLHGLPNDIFSNLDPFALIILIPILDIVVYPALHRMGIKFTALKRIAAGFFTGALAMLSAAVLQHYIYKTHPCGNFPNECDEELGPSPLNVWIQTPSYILIALSEIFASITGLEYAFTKAPKNMRSLVMSVFLFTSAIASALNEALVPLADDPRLVWNYGVVGVISAVGFICFWLSVRKLDAKEDELNNIAEGHMDAGKS